MKLFTYGTLQRGESRHTLLEKSRFLGEAKTTPEYSLYDLGPFPALRIGGHTSVHGELYEIDGTLLGILDMIEGHPHLYRREEISLIGEEEAIAYFMTQEVLVSLPEVKLIESGSWRER